MPGMQWIILYDKANPKAWQCPYDEGEENICRVIVMGWNTKVMVENGMDSAHRKWWSTYCWLYYLGILHPFSFCQFQSFVITLPCAVQWMLGYVLILCTRFSFCYIVLLIRYYQLSCFRKIAVVHVVYSS